MTEVWLLTGIPGAGKSTIARMLARSMPRAAHIEGDLLHSWIVSGRVDPGQEPDDEFVRQWRLTAVNMCLLARSFVGAGFVPVLDYVTASRGGVALFQEQLTGLDLRLVVLDPGQAVALRRDAERSEKTVAAPFVYLEAQMRRELVGLGLWVKSGDMTPEETLRFIQEHAAEARLPGV